jgi:hypothetical protein
MAAYQPRAVFQLTRDPGHPKGSALRGVNCDPTAAAVLVDFVTCGARTTTGAEVRELTGDFEGGTTIRQVSRAVAKGFGIDLDVTTASFDRLIRALEHGRGVSLCGSSVATFGTPFQSSPTFKDNHQLALTDIRTNPDGSREILVYDPLADKRKAGVKYRGPAWIPVGIVRTFAGQFDLRSREERAQHKPPRPLGMGLATYAVTEVNRCVVVDHHVTVDGVQLRPGAVRVGGDDGKVLEVTVPIAKVRDRPHTGADIVGRKVDGDLFRAFQKIRAQNVAGSRVWFGDRSGTRWMHSSRFTIDPGQDVEQPGDDPEAVNLPDGVETTDADDEVLMGVEEDIGEPIVDPVPA